MELDQLRYFLQVAADGNFTRAAEHLGISQPALSRSIGRLEEEIGQPVFQRQSKCVSLTDAGKLLQGRAKAVLSLSLSKPFDGSVSRHGPGVCRND